MTDTVPPIASIADDRLEWETHRRGEPVPEADQAFEHLFRNNLGWTIGISSNRGHPSPKDCAGTIFWREYLARPAPPPGGAFRGYLYWQIRAECTRSRREQAKAERIESEWMTRHPTYASPAAVAEDPPAVKAAPVPFRQSVDLDEDPDLLGQVVQDAPICIEWVLRRFPDLSGQEAAHIYLRTQDLWSKTITALMGFPSIAAERTNWSRLNRKVKNLPYGVDLNDEIRRQKPPRRRMQNG